jgi:hypothetical protein
MLPGKSIWNPINLKKGIETPPEEQLLLIRLDSNEERWHNTKIKCGIPKKFTQ